MIFAWVYEITPEGLKPTVDVPHHQSIRKLSGRRLDRAIIAVLAVALAYFVVDKFWVSKHFPTSQPVASAAEGTTSQSTAALPAVAAAFAPPPHSLAVLPFVNMSGDKEQEYSSDGLTEELLNSLSRINELQVAARTSSFYFKGEHADLATIAHKLNVASILEGSVRRSGQTLRITAQLNNAVTGYHLWSQTYDANLSDVLALQTEIANAVAGALKVTLLGDVAAKIEVGGTRNPAAFDAYLRASKVDWASQTERDVQTAVAGYTEAIRLDPDYALAYAERSLALAFFSRNFATGPAIRDSHAKAQADARKATALAPELAEGHLALAKLLVDDLEFTRALGEYRHALTLEPGNARVLSNYGRFAVEMGQTEAGLAAVHRSAALDPLNPESQEVLGESLVQAHRYGEAIATLKEAKTLAPDDVWITAWLGFAYGHIGDIESAREVCESIKIVDDFNRGLCLVVTYDRLGRHADAENLFTQLRASSGERPAVFYAMIYAERGDMSRALEWLETAMRYRDPYLIRVKMAPSLDPLRKEPRFQAIERALKFPN